MNSYLSCFTKCLLNWRSPVSFEVFQDASPNNAAKANGHSISNKPSQMMKRDRLVGSHEPIASGERLQQGSFPQGDRAILFWVAKPSVPEPMALCCHSRSRAVPPHPSVDTWVCFARLCLVTICYQVIGPVTPSPARFRSSDSAKISSRQGASAVQFVLRRYPARCDRLKSPDCLTDSPTSVWGVGGCYQVYLTML